MAKADLIKEIQSKDLAPDVKEKALAAIERIAYIGESDFDDTKTSIIDAFGWDNSQEGYNFWSDIFNASDDAPTPSPHLPSSPGKLLGDEIFARIKQYGRERFEAALQVGIKLANDEPVSDGDLLDALHTFTTNLDIANPLLPIANEIFQRYMDKVEMTVTPNGIEREWFNGDAPTA